LNFLAKIFPYRPPEGVYEKNENVLKTSLSPRFR
jgi:hypothetical protein